ncbi:hypothetical protein FEM48_Zijuj10G0070300 [Ziziphus jujuba var. spinosa]|uniref:Protein kinase domain-containing protein n=1 Tax=Ziziphus jujuba var. spinosa TaxID=714518 RepID=A0A978UM00_ZIZJJ|nr:hypothetical protein FEM48_Zijuj10G0070300 [Ziziphus jujuba var. spinosa]
MPPPLHSLLFFFFCSLFTASIATNHSCSSKLESSASSSSSCPPFSSTPPFPFSSSPGCGHPSFQVKCSTPYAIISINDITFSLINYEQNSTSFRLSPHPSSSNSSYVNDSTRNYCSSSHFVSIPSHSINLSGTPFRVSDSSCSRLSALRPCSPPTLPNCSHCPWECKLIKNPVRLLHDCGSTRRPDSGSDCNRDVLGYLNDFLTNYGISLEWDEVQDSYFSNCRDCRSKNGVCGFNSSDADKKFLCFHSRARLSPPWITQHSPNRITILFAIFVLTCLFLFVLVALLSRRLRSSATEEDQTTLFLHRHRSASLLPPVFTYEELESSTNHFDPKRKIGDGGFGSVYLGQLYDGRIVAVKYLHKHNKAASENRAFSTKSFCNEILILSSIDHPNLVVDPVLAVDGESSINGVDAVAELAFRCVAAEKDDRPDAREVVEELKQIRSRARGLFRSSNSNVSSGGGGGDGDVAEGLI